MTAMLQYAPDDRIYAHPEVLADFMRRICGCEPEEYALSDESYLSDMDTIEPELLFEAVRREYGLDVPQGKDEPFLWRVIEQIATRR